MFPILDPGIQFPVEIIPYYYYMSLSTRLMFLTLFSRQLALIFSKSFQDTKWSTTTSRVNNLNMDPYWKIFIWNKRCMVYSIKNSESLSSSSSSSSKSFHPTTVINLFPQHHPFFISSNESRIYWNMWIFDYKFA